MENLTELRQLLEELPGFDERWDPRWTNYIITYRQTRPQNQPAGGGGQGGNNQGQLVNSLLDLVGGQGSPFPNDVYEMRYYGPILYDYLTTQDTPIVGRININQVSRTVLEAFLSRSEEQFDEDIPMISIAELVLGPAAANLDFAYIIDEIMERRYVDPFEVPLEDAEMRYPFWIYTEGIIDDLAVMRQLEPYFCSQGSVFKGTVVGRFDDKSPTCRIEIWLDASEGGKLPKVIRHRDISNLGAGFRAELLRDDEQIAR
jgi:hypothetical protein